MRLERAKELIGSCRYGELPFAFVPNGSKWNDSYPVKEHGITKEEWEYVQGIWRMMPGYTCFMDALHRVANGRAVEMEKKRDAELEKLRGSNEQLYRFDDAFEKVYTYSKEQDAYVFLTTYLNAGITATQRESTKIKRMAEWGKAYNNLRFIMMKRNTNLSL